MGTILIGNIKGPQGSQGIQGPQGPVGPVGPTGPGADIYNGLDQTEAGVAGLDSYQGRVLDQKKLDVAKVANNLTTAVEGYALDARQGKALDEKKLNASAFVVENNLTTTAAGHVLDARQGKALSDKVGSLFTVYERQVYQNRLANAGLKEIQYTLPGGKHMSIVYCVFKTTVAIPKDAAIATGFSEAFGLFLVNISGNRNDTHAVEHFYLNPNGSLCVYEDLPAGVWCSCNGVYLTNG